MKSTLFLLIFSFLLASCSCNTNSDGIYCYSFEKQGKFTICIVDGSRIRQNIYKEFVYGGNEQRYPFVPKNEIWIDGQISCEETEYSIATELIERKLMSSGKSYDDAYETAIEIVRQQRMKMANFVNLRPKIVVPASLDRETGILDPTED